MSRKHQRRKNAHISPVVGLPLPRPALRPRRRFLLSSTAIVLAGCLAFSSPAWANEECGAPPSVTCSSGTYSSGITYDTDTSFFTDLTMVIEGAVVDDTVHIDTSSGAIDVTIQSGALFQTLGDGAEAEDWNSWSTVPKPAKAPTVMGPRSSPCSSPSMPISSLARVWSKDDCVSTVWRAAVIRHEFLGEQEAEVSGLTFTHDLPGTMGFLATALEVEIIEDSLTLIVRGEFAKGSEGEEFTGSLGLNLTL